MSSDNPGFGPPASGILADCHRTPAFGTPSGIEDDTEIARKIATYDHMPR